MFDASYNSVRAGTSYAPSPEAATAPADLDPAVFDRWPLRMQVAYLRNVDQFLQATPSALLGPPGNQVLARVLANGVDVETTKVPPGFSDAPAYVTPEAFEAWDTPFQVAYVRSKGTGAPRSVDLGFPGQTVRASLSTDARDVLFTASAGFTAQARIQALLDTPPARLAAADFLGLTPDLQLAYAQRYGATLVPVADRGTLPDRPTALTFHDPAADPATLTALTVEANGQAFRIGVPASAFLGFPTDAASRPADAGASVSPQTFLSWPKPVQQAFVERGYAGFATTGVAGGLYPKSMVIGAASDNRLLASVAGAGQDVAVVALPPGYDTEPGLLAAATFLRWPEAVQSLYVAERGSAGPFGPTVTIGAPGAQIAAARTRVQGSADTQLSFTVPGLLALRPAVVDPDVFSMLSPTAQLNYVQRHVSVGGQAILGGGEQRALLQRPSANGVNLLSFPPGYETPPAELDAATFLGFDLPFRKLYVQENLGNTAGTLTIGAIAVDLDVYGNMLIAEKTATNFWDPVRNSDAVAGSTGTATPPATLDPAAFAAWPPSVQADYVTTNATTQNPPTLMIGRPGQQTLARVAPDGNGVDFVTPPAAFTAPPRVQTLADFRALDLGLQVQYLRQNGVGTPPSVEIGPAGQTLTLTLAGNGSRVDIASSAGYRALPEVAAILGTADPLTVTAQDFLALPPDLQLEYAAAHLNGSSVRVQVVSSLTGNAANYTFAGGLVLDGADAESSARLSIRANGQSLTIGIPVRSFAGLSDDLFNTNVSGIAQQELARAKLPAASFLALPPQIRAAVVEQAFNAAGPPNTVEIGNLANGGPGILASLPRFGAPLDIVAKPAGFRTAPDELAPGRYLDWPSAARATYFNLRANGAPTLEIGTPPNAITLTRTPFQYAVASAQPDMAAAPGSLDPDVFALWPLQSQYDYINARSTTNPPSLQLGPAGNRVRLSFDASGSGVAAEPFPPAYDTPPQTLPADTFLSWAPVFRDAYVRDNLRGAQALTIGPVGAQVTAAYEADGRTLTIRGGVLQATPGQNADDIPYYYLPGSAVGVNSAQNDAQAQKLYPALTGDPGTPGATIPDEQKPAAFELRPNQITPQEFGSWHSAVQLEYVRLHGAPKPPAAGPMSLTVGTGTETITAMIANPVAPATVGSKLYVVESLQKQDLVKMPLADQAAIAALPAFAKIGTTLGLSTDRTAVQGLVTAALNLIASPAGKLDPTGKTLVDGAMPADDKKVFSDQINIIQSQIADQGVFSLKDVNDKINAIVTRFARANAFAYTVYGAGKPIAESVQWTPVGQVAGTPVSGTAPPLGDILKLPYALEQPLGPDGKALNTIQVLGPGSDGKPRYRPVLQAVSANPIVDFQRDLPKVDFSNPSKSPVDDQTYTVTRQYLIEQTQVGNNLPVGEGGTPDVFNFVTVTFSYKADVKMASGASTDNNAAINAGYKTFMAQETQIRDLAVKAQTLAETGTNGAKQLDVPTLVFLFQLYANLKSEAVLRAETEEINQTNALLKAYALVQRMINRAIKDIDKPNANDPVKVRITATTDEERAAVRMFNNYGTKFAQDSPIERIKGITRPLNNINIDVPAQYTSAGWQQIANQLSDTVTLLNQESQLKMNDVNALTKQKDRNFDLANNALAKASEILQKIASLV